MLDDLAAVRHGNAERLDAGSPVLRRRDRFYVDLRCPPRSVVLATVVGFLFGLIAVRSSGIYFLMITLALGMVVYALANQNRSFFGGHTGILGIRPRNSSVMR